VASRRTSKRPTRVGVPYKKSEATRELLLVSAIKLIAKRGLLATSLQDIAEAAGVSKGGVHYYFESKDDLYAKVLVKCCDVLEARIIKAFVSGEVAPIERVENALAEMWRVRRDGEPEVRCLTELHILARQDVPLRHELAAALRRARQQMIDTGISAMLALGIKPRVDVQIVPRLIIAMLDGLALHNEVDPLATSEEATLLRAVELMVMGLFEI
jgi:AcrR family transcriptional regulator